MAQCQPGHRIAFLGESTGFDFADWFENDDRPTMVLDLNNVSIEQPRLHFLFANKAFRGHAPLSTRLNIILQDPLAPAATSGQMECSQHFTQWATDTSSPTDSHKRKSSSMASDGHIWTKSTIRKRWRVVSGSKLPGGQPDGGETRVTPSPVAAFERLTTDTSKDTLPIQESMPSMMLWTDALPWTEHASLFRETNWSKTALGPLASWPSNLRQMVLYLFADSRPSCLFWGPQRTIMYNESYVPIASTKHPKSFASTCAVTWTEVYSQIDNAMRKAEHSGYAATMENQLFVIERQGSLEE
ncbi:MAG: hypothetical protein Q9186_001124 [Xanthomendoza sp. 1 TL-2023]